MRSYLHSGRIINTKQHTHVPYHPLGSPGCRKYVGGGGAGGSRARSMLLAALILIILRFDRIFGGLNMLQNSPQSAYCSSPVKNLIFHGRHKWPRPNGSTAPPSVHPLWQATLSGGEKHMTGTCRPWRRTKSSLGATPQVQQEGRHFGFSDKTLKRFTGHKF